MWSPLRLVYFPRFTKKLRKLFMAKRRTIGKKSNSRHSYSEKVKRGTHPYKYPFATGAAAIAERARNVIKFSPPVSKSDPEVGYLEKPKSRRRA